MRGIGLSQAAKLFGVANGRVVLNWECGLCIPRREQMVRVYRETCGAVEPNDFYGLPELTASPLRQAMRRKRAARRAGQQP